MTSLSVLGAHRFARCWKFVQGATEVYVTDHDLPLVLSDGNTYEPSGGVSASADSRRVDYEADDRTFTGAITSEKFTESDLKNGFWRNATVDEYLVDHRFPWAGEFLSRRFKVGKIEANDKQGFFRVEVAGLMSQLNRSVGRRFTRRCSWLLFDNNCGVDRASFQASITVVTVNADGSFIATPSAHDEDGFFDDGEITCTGGNNNGSTQVVRAYTAADNKFVLHFNPTLDVEVGDTATVHAGCNKLSGVNPDGTDDPTGHCKNKFNNLAEFGGMPALTDPDDLYDVPDAKTSTE